MLFNIDCCHFHYFSGPSGTWFCQVEAMVVTIDTCVMWNALVLSPKCLVENAAFLEKAVISAVFWRNRMSEPPGKSLMLRPAIRTGKLKQ